MTAHSDDPATLRERIEEMLSVDENTSLLSDLVAGLGPYSSVQLLAQGVAKLETLLRDCLAALYSPPASAVDVELAAHRKKHRIEDGIEQDLDGVTYCPTCGDLKGWKPPFAASGEKEKGK